MALRIMKTVAGSTLRPQYTASILFRPYSLYEPDYLEVGKSKIPLHDVLNVQLTAHDYPVLESYQKFIHKLATNMGIDVENAWALPAQEFRIERFKPQSDVIDAEYRLKTYFRNVQLSNLSATSYPILLRLLDASLPEGVTLNVVKHEPEHDQIRLVPDKELLELKSQLDEYGGQIKKKKR